MTAFIPANKRYSGKLELFVPAVARVHSGTHPELLEVKRRCEILPDASKIAGTRRPDLDQEFTALEEITGNCTVPEDICESSQTVCRMPAGIHAAYEN